MKIRHLVLPMAGRGKRLRPLTLRRPKPLVRANGQPLVEYILQETAGSSIKEVVCVISPQHMRHFEKYLKGAKKRFSHLNFHIRQQKELLGDGHAVLQAYDLVKGRPFAVRFSDDLLFHNPPALHVLCKIYERLRAPVMLLERVPKRLVHNYGVVGGVKKRTFASGTIYAIKKIVEKPTIKEAPSNLTVVGGYALPPYILADLKKIFAELPDYENDALRLVRAFEREIMNGKSVYGWEFPDVRLDCGTFDGFRRAEAFLGRKLTQ